MYLIGDIGATFSRLAIIDKKNHVIHEEKVRNRDFFSFSDLLQKFLRGKKEKIQKACFGIAGVVSKQKVKMTNLHWTLDAKQIEKTFSISQVVFFNDMILHAKGIETLSEKDFFVLHQGKKREGNKLFIFPGTGLGVAFGIFLDGKKYLHIASEAGHSDFAPKNALEREFYLFLQKKYRHVSYERILSGPGILDLYCFFQSKETKKKIFLKLSSEEIVDKGLRKQNPICEKVLTLFISIYGSFVGNMALDIFPVSAIFLGGSLSIKISKKLEEEKFFQAVTSKGRFSSLLKTIPVYVVMQEKTSLLGAISVVQ